jgi:hypothetical protein
VIGYLIVKGEGASPLQACLVLLGSGGVSFDLWELKEVVPVYLGAKGCGRSWGGNCRSPVAVSLGVWAPEEETLLAGLAGIEGKVGTEILRKVSQTPEGISGKITSEPGSIKFPVWIRIG